MCRNSLHVKILVAYYGFVQTVHFFALLWAFLFLRQTNTLSFLAYAPVGGWTAQAQHFLIATGIVDAVNILLALLFVYGFFLDKRWWFWLGTVVTTVSIVSALVYGYGTFYSGAWMHHPFAYLLLAALFIPIAILVIVIAAWGLKAHQS